MPLSKWSHVALVYNGVNRIFYINGVQSGSFSAPAISADNSGDAIGGVSDNSSDGYFDGEIDEGFDLQYRAERKPDSGDLRGGYRGQVP